MIKIISIAALIIFASCSKEHYGCTKSEVKKSAKHFRKSVNWCANEAMRQSLSHFPFKESDSTWSDYVKGKDTQWIKSDPIIYDCDEFIRQRDSLAKLGIKTEKKALVKCPDCPYTIDTVNKYRSTIKEDFRKIGLLQGQLDIANQKISDKDKENTKLKIENAKDNTAKNTYKWILIALFAVAASIVGVKYIIPKVLK